MKFWHNHLDKYSLVRSLLLKCGILGLGIAVVLWAGWPQPKKNGYRDHSSAPIVLSEDKRVQVVPGQSIPILITSPQVSVESSSIEPKNSNFLATQISLLIDLNESSQVELKGLPGIGVVLADRIVSYRTKYGEFRHVNDLENVSGIGEKRLQRLLPFVKVDAVTGDIES